MTPWRDRWRPAATLGIVLLLGGFDLVQHVGAPVQVQIPLIFKALTFDRNRSGPGDTVVVVGIVYQSRYRSSLIVRDEATAAIRQFTDVLAPREVRSVSIDLDGGELGSLVDRLRPTVLYVAPLRAARIETVSAVARQRGIATVTGVPQYVESGLAIGIGLRSDRPEIVINLSAAKAEGADYGSQLLRLARLVGEAEP